MKAKNLKKSFLLSVLSLVLCVSMFVGTTFAWFTDSITNTKNKIMAGNLDVELYFQVEGQTDWTKVNDNTNIFKEGALWEPGHTEVVKFKVANEGTLALKYHLGINIAEETGSVNQLGDPFKLSDYIKYGIVEGEQDYADRDKAVEAVAASARSISSYAYTNAGQLKAAEESIVTMVVYMPTTTGNEANAAKGAEVPTIFLGLNLYATQLANEQDSFGADYDEAAPWTGEIAKPEQDINGTWQIGTAEELAWFAQLVNGTLPTTYAATEKQHNAVLTHDIDLNNLPWTPIGRTLTAEEKAAGAHAFDFQFGGKSNDRAVFDGQGYTVYNLNVNETANAGLFGAAVYAAIQNVNVDGAKIVSNHFAGTVLAQGYAKVENCHVANATVSCTPELIGESWDNGDKVGGVVGKISESNSNGVYGVLNCSATNVTVTAYRDAGGILGYAGNYADVVGNTVTKVTMIQDATHDYKKFDTVEKYNINPVVGDSTRSTGVVVDKNTESECVVVPMVASTNVLNDAIKDASSGDTVAVGSGTFTLKSMTGKEGLTIVGVPGESVINGVNSFDFGTDTTVKGLTFSSNDSTNNAVRYGYTHGDVVFEDCVFAGKTYGFHVDQANGGTITFKNCTFEGFNAFGSDGTYYFENCTFKYSGSQGHTNMWGKGTFTNCTFGDKTSVGRGGNYPGTGTVIIDGEDIGYQCTFIGSASALRSFRTAVDNNGCVKDERYVLVADIDLGGTYWYPVEGSFAGVFDGNGHTISNMDLTHEYMTQTTNVAFFTSIASTAVIKNVTFDNAKVAGTHYVGVIVGWEGNEAANATIDNCHVINSTITCDTDAAGDNGDKVGGICGYAVTLNITNCSVKDTTIKAYRDFGGILGCANGSKTNVTGNTVENVTLVIDNDVNYKNYQTDAEHNANPVVGRVNAGHVADNTVK